MIEIYDENYLRFNRDKLKNELKYRIAFSNDSWFNANYLSKVPVTKKAIEVMLAVDSARYKSGYQVISRFDKGATSTVSMQHLSTGCKTILNCLSFPNTIFNMDECGENALIELLRLYSAKVYFLGTPPKVWSENIENNFRLYKFNSFKDYNDYDTLCEGARKWQFS